MWEGMILSALHLVLTHASPKIRTRLDEALDSIEKYCKGTKNPYDDVLIAQLKQLLGSQQNHGEQSA